MAINIPNVVVQRLKSAAPKFRDILKKKEIEHSNEADTAGVVTDMLEEVFGFKRIEDIRREFPIQGGKCDIAVIPNVMPKKKPAYLIEVKSIRTKLRDNHVNQVVNYASGADVENVVLTNGIQWQVYRVTRRGKVKVDKNLIFEVDFLNLNMKRKEQLEHLFSLSSHGVQKCALDEVYEHSQVLNKYVVGNLLLGDPVLEVVRREMRRLPDNPKTFPLEQIKQMLEGEVINSKLLGEDGEDARKLIARASRRQKKAATNKTTRSADKNNTEPGKRRIFGGILG